MFRLYDFVDAIALIEKSVVGQHFGSIDLQWCNGKQLCWLKNWLKRYQIMTLLGSKLYCYCCSIVLHGIVSQLFFPFVFLTSPSEANVQGTIEISTRHT